VRPLGIDLFCGLGGWTEGLLAEGYDVVGFDIERHDYGTGGYPAQLVLQDVLTLHGRQFKDAALIVASPPCQEFSYMAMPWTRAKQIERALHGIGQFPKGYTGSRTLPELTALFNACFRIQREAIEAAGYFIPLVVENVRGAEKWVGRARWHYGSFYLWGDVPALMPIPGRLRKSLVGSWDVNRANYNPDHSWNCFKSSGLNWSDRSKHGQDFTRVAGNQATKVPSFRFDGSGKSFQTAATLRHDQGRKMPAEINEAIRQGKSPARWTNTEEHYFGNKGNWLERDENGKRALKGQRATWSNSFARKAASAAIAKIPFPLAQYIAQYWKPREEKAMIRETSL
jgi:hypothetical protein